MVDIPHVDPATSTGLGWWLWRDGAFVLVRCPNGHTHSLRTPAGGHSIADDGTVTPSLVCPSCSFHEWGRLQDWEVERG